jgi:hypothetical protein
MCSYCGFWCHYIPKATYQLRTQRHSTKPNLNNLNEVIPLCIESIYFFIFYIYIQSVNTTILYRQRLKRHVATYKVIIRLAKNYEILQSGCAHLESQMVYNMRRDLRLVSKVDRNHYLLHLYLCYSSGGSVYACSLLIWGLLIGFLVDVSVVVVVLLFSWFSSGGVCIRLLLCGFSYWLGCVSPVSVIMKPYPLCSVIPTSAIFDHIFPSCRVIFLCIVACVRVYGVLITVCNET